MIDGYGGEKELLDNRDFVFGALDELPGKIDMRKMGDPVIYRAEPNGKKDPGGWSGFVVIQESHISIHTFPGRGFITADVYTCRNGIDVKYVENYFKDKFKLKDVELNFVKRGTRYPEHNL